MTQNAERKFVSVLFADIVDSSRMIDGIDPEDANEILLSIIQILIDSVHLFGGTVTQVLGDGIMAVFGAPCAQEDHAFRACLAADNMLSATKPASKVKEIPANHFAEIRIGLNSGKVVTQTLNLSRLPEYRIAGDTVHLAARMEETAYPGSVFLTKHTLDLVSDHVEVKQEGKYKFRAASKPITFYKLVGITRRKPFAYDQPVRPMEAFIGREKDLQLLQRALAEAEAGNGNNLVIQGDPGIGKTRLIREFLQNIQTRKCRIVEGHLLPSGLSTPLDILAHIISDLLAIEANVAPKHLRATVTESLDALDIRTNFAASPLLELMGVPSDDPAWAGLDPSERLSVTSEAIVQVILAASRSYPVIIVLEDFHWADSETQLLMKELAGRLSSSKVLSLLTLRPVRDKLWTHWPNTAEHDLRPLSRRQCSEFLSSLLGTGPDIGNLKELLIEKTQGNPFFLLECFRALEQSDMIYGELGSYRLAQPVSELEIPVTVHGVLAARIDGLPPAEREMLLNASVIGQRFNSNLLKDLSGVDDQTLLGRLNHLKSAGFVERTRVVPNLEYSFRHALIHDVAYGTLAKRRRLVLHARVMASIRKRRTEQLTGKAELLAHHAFRSEQWPWAYVSCREAGRNAQAKSKNREAAGFFEQSLDALKKLPQSQKNTEREADVRLEFALPLRNLGKRDRLLRELQHARDLAHQLGDEQRLGKIASSMMFYHWAYNDIGKAIQTGQDVLKIAKKVKDQDLEIQVMTRLGGVYTDQGDFVSAIRMVKSVIARIPVEELHTHFGLRVVASVGCRALLARCLGEVGQFKEAMVVGDESLQIADESGHAFSKIYANVWVGNVFLRQGNFEQSVPLITRGLDICKETQSKLLYPISIGSLGYAYVKIGNVSRGLSLLEEAAKDADNQALQLRLSLWTSWLAEAFLLTGYTDKAINYAHRALKAAQYHGDIGNEAWALRLLGEVHNALDSSSSDTAMKYFLKAHEIALARQMLPLAAHCRLGLGRLHRLQGAWDNTRRELNAAHSEFRELEMPYWLPQVEAEMREAEKAKSLPRTRRRPISSIVQT